MNLNNTLMNTGGMCIPNKYTLIIVISLLRKHL